MYAACMQESAQWPEEGMGPAGTGVTGAQKLTWVLGTEFCSSVRAIGALNC